MATPCPVNHRTVTTTKDTQTFVIHRLVNIDCGIFHLFSGIELLVGNTKLGFFRVDIQRFFRVILVETKFFHLILSVRQNIKLIACAFVFGKQLLIDIHAIGSVNQHIFFAIIIIVQAAWKFDFIAKISDIITC